MKYELSLWVGFAASLVYNILMTRRLLRLEYLFDTLAHQVLRISEFISQGDEDDRNNQV